MLDLQDQVFHLTEISTGQEVNMDLNFDPADFQLCDGFGLDLDFINSA